ncbi:MAG: hypothetical protein ABL907_10960 [Hyphomicrobium sp.]
MHSVVDARTGSRDNQEIHQRLSTLSWELSVCLDAVLSEIQRGPTSGTSRQLHVARELVAAQYSVTQQLLSLSDAGHSGHAAAVPGSKTPALDVPVGINGLLGASRGLLPLRTRPTAAEESGHAIAAHLQQAFAHATPVHDTSNEPVVLSLSAMLAARQAVEYPAAAVRPMPRGTPGYGHDGPSGPPSSWPQAHWPQAHWPQAHWPETTWPNAHQQQTRAVLDDISYAGPGYASEEAPSQQPVEYDTDDGASANRRIAGPHPQKIARPAPAIQTATQLGALPGHARHRRFSRLMGLVRPRLNLRTSAALAAGLMLVLGGTQAPRLWTSSETAAPTAGSASAISTATPAPEANERPADRAPRQSAVAQMEPAATEQAPDLTRFSPPPASSIYTGVAVVPSTPPAPAAVEAPEATPVEPTPQVEAVAAPKPRPNPPAAPVAANPAAKPVPPKPPEQKTKTAALEPAKPPESKPAPPAKEKFAPVLLTLRDGDAALRIFKELQQRHPAALGDKTAELRAFIGPDQRPWHRLLAVPASAKGKAEDVCKALGEEGTALGCEVALY